jgi:hypothetical protein
MAAQNIEGVPGIAPGQLIDPAPPRAARRLPRGIDVARMIVGRPLYLMLALLILEALLSATTTYLVIQAGRDVANGRFIVADLAWVFCAQAASFVSGATSWIFAEQAGYKAFGRYMLEFARINRHETALFGDKGMREQVEPFLTGETFSIFFTLMYELEGDLKLLLGLLFNALVLGMEISGGLPIAYAGVFALLLGVQLLLRNPIARAYRANQSTRNRMTAQGYTAWDNVFAGNSYNLRLWMAGFKSRLRDGLRAQLRAVVAREGISAAGGIFALAVVFGVMIVIAAGHSADTAVLVAMAATLPRQIDMTQDVNELAAGWNDLLAIWTRIDGVTENIRPAPEPGHDDRIRFDRLTLSDEGAALEVGSIQAALQAVKARRTGRINVRGDNGVGKSTLLAALKARLGSKTYYWPANDRLAFRFSAAQKRGVSSGERQVSVLREITERTDAAFYLFDEWDANLDRLNRAAAAQMIDQLALRARVVEISHRDAGK